MIYLDTPNKKLEIVLASTVTTSQLEVSAFYFDTLPQDNSSAQNRGGVKNSLTDNTTDVTIVAAPSGVGRVRNIHTIFVYNKDTVSHTVTIKLDNSGSETVFVKQTIRTNEGLVYEDQSGWEVLSPIAISLVGNNDLTFVTSGSTTITLPTTGTMATLAGTESLTNKTLDNSNIITVRDDRFTIQDNSDTTKQAVFQASGITTATTRTYTLPDANGTLLYSGGPLGTPSTGTLTNATGLPLSTGVTGDLPFANLTQGSALSVLGVTGNATADVASIAAGSDHNVLRRSGTALTFGAINLASSNAVTGTLPVGNGGTGATTLTANNVILGNGGSAVQFVAPGTSGNILTSNGTTWQSSTPAASVAYFTTGDVKVTLKTTADSGWVMMDDGTIGNASSGGTTRANADTSDLFTLLWNNTADAQCAVSGGRGASAAADFAANKTIALPKVLGRALAISGAGSGLTSRVLALALGDENLAAHTHTGPSHTHTGTTASNGAHTHTVGRYDAAGSSVNGFERGDDIGGATTATSSDGAHTHTFTTDAGGTGATGSTGAGSAGNMQPSIFLNIMIKL